METSRELAPVGGFNRNDENESARTKGDTRGIVASVRWLSILAILAALLTMIRALPISDAMAAINGWISGLGVLGPVVLALVYIVATVLFVPGTILTLAAGALFGLGVGTVSLSI